MMADRVPAAEAMVCTMLFSLMLWPLNRRSTAMEITAAGMEVAKVKPTFRPRYTLAAVKMRVIRPPMIMPRRVNSGREALEPAADDAFAMPGPFYSRL